MRGGAFRPQTKRSNTLGLIQSNWSPSKNVIKPEYDDSFTFSFSDFKICTVQKQLKLGFRIYTTFLSFPSFTTTWHNYLASCFIFIFIFIIFFYPLNLAILDNIGAMRVGGDYY